MIANGAGNRVRRPGFSSRRIYFLRRGYILQSSYSFPTFPRFPPFPPEERRNQGPTANHREEIQFGETTKKKNGDTRVRTLVANRSDNVSVEAKVGIARYKCYRYQSVITVLPSLKILSGATARVPEFDLERKIAARVDILVELPRGDLSRTSRDREAGGIFD